MAKEVGVEVVKDQNVRQSSGTHDRRRKEVEDFILRPDISYTMPGAVKDEMVTWNDNGKKECKRKHYMTMTMSEAHALYTSECIDPAGPYKKARFCDMRPENILIQGDSPKDQYRCKTCENLFKKLVAMGIHYTSELWEGVLCDTSPNSQCWLNTCMTCCNGSQFKPINPLHSKTVYHQ